MRKASGFTIVELLIAIVVVAILATISLNAYGGATTRAEDSLITSKISSIARMFVAYAATTGGLVPQADWACVGEADDFPAENGYAAEWCHQPYQDPTTLAAGDDHPINHTVNNKLKAVVSRMTNSRIPEVDLGGGVKYRGILYDSSATQNSFKPVLQYYVKGSRSSCPIGSKEFSTSTYTRCNYLFTTVTSETGT